MAKVKSGVNEILFIYTSIKNAGGTVVAANYFPIGCLTSNSTNETQEMKDGTPNKCDLSPDPTFGRYSYEITFEAISYEDDGLKATQDDIRAALKAARDSKSPIYWKKEITLSDDSKKTEFGKGFITALSSTAPADGEVTWNGTIRGSGEISKTDLKV